MMSPTTGTRPTIASRPDGAVDAGDGEAAFEHHLHRLDPAADRRRIACPAASPGASSSGAASARPRSIAGLRVHEARVSFAAYLGIWASAGKGWKAQGLAAKPSTLPRTSDQRSGAPKRDIDIRQRQFGFGLRQRAGPCGGVGLGQRLSRTSASASSSHRPRSQRAIELVEEPARRGIARDPVDQHEIRGACVLRPFQPQADGRQLPRARSRNSRSQPGASPMAMVTIGRLRQIAFAKLLAPGGDAGGRLAPQLLERLIVPALAGSGRDRRASPGDTGRVVGTQPPILKGAIRAGRSIAMASPSRTPVIGEQAVVGAHLQAEQAERGIEPQGARRKRAGLGQREDRQRAARARPRPRRFEQGDGFARRAGHAGGFRARRPASPLVGQAALRGGRRQGQRKAVLLVARQAPSGRFRRRAAAAPVRAGPAGAGSRASAWTGAFRSRARPSRGLRRPAQGRGRARCRRRRGSRRSSASRALAAVIGVPSGQLPSRRRKM